MAQTAHREFSEELGNPDKKGLLFSIINDAKHRRSLAITNQIGETKEQIANRIIEKKASRFSLYINISAIYVNNRPIKHEDMLKELGIINLI